MRCFLTLVCCFSLLHLCHPSIGQAFQPEETETTVSEAPVVSEPAPVPATEVPEITTGKAFLLKLKQGGRTMIFLLLCSVVTVACAMERLVKQRRGRILPGKLTRKARELWQTEKFEELENVAAKNDSTLGRMIAAVVRHRHGSLDRVSVIAADIASRDLKRHLQRAYPLAVVATIAPLLGLFGTVIGMIGAFDKIAIMGELANPAAFGGDIGKALITTGAGLAIAIASLVLYHWFKSRISVYGVELEEQVSELINDWFASPKPADSATSGN